MATQMEQFRESVIKALVLRGSGANGARVEVLQTDARYMGDLHANGLTADQAAAQVIRDHLARQTASAAQHTA